MVSEDSGTVRDVLPVATRMRRKALNAAIFSELGLRVTPRLWPGLLRLYNIAINNSLAPDVNGEQWFISLLNDPRVIVDVGFHRGDWTKEVVRRFPMAAVYGFDPWPPARRFFDSCGFRGDVQLFDVGLSNEVGRARFYDYNDACNSLALRDLEGLNVEGAYDVDVTTLDQWCVHHSVDHIDLLKIDVEGYDLAVLEGSRQLLADQAVDAFSFEYASGWIGSKRFLGEAVQYISEQGYVLFKLFPKFLAPFVYQTVHENFYGAMFVALSPRTVSTGVFPIKRIRGL